MRVRPFLPWRALAGPSCLALALGCGAPDADRPASRDATDSAPVDTAGDRARPDAESGPSDPIALSRTPAGHLYVWTADVDGAESDFLAVIDVDPESPDYATVTATHPVGRAGTLPHHTEHRMPDGRRLLANGFRSGETFRFDLSEPGAPRLLGSFGQVDGFSYPHSYERLPNGNVLATFQGTGEDNLDPGGLVEFTDTGEVVRSASASDPAAGGALIRPYSLAVVPALDRVVVTSYDMGEDMGFEGGRRGRTHVVQVWRLSDLSVLATIDLPPGPGGGGDEQPGEPRLLSDGRTVLVTTFTCGLYRMTGLGGDPVPADSLADAPNTPTQEDAPGPSAEFVHGFRGGGCAVPVVIGDFWIQSVPSENAVVALDVAAPDRPREVSRVTLGERNFPHWLAADPATGRLVVTDRGDGERRLFLLSFDEETGQLTLVEGFRGPDGDGPGVDFGRPNWPHGPSGPARAHGAVFGE